MQLLTYGQNIQTTYQVCKPFFILFATEWRKTGCNTVLALSLTRSLRFNYSPLQGGRRRYVVDPLLDPLSDHLGHAGWEHSRRPIYDG